MSELTQPQPKNRIVVWLFNPFMYAAGSKALIIGLLAIAATAYIGSLGNVHLDGVLDLHIGAQSPLWLFLSEGFINWFSLAMLLTIGGLILKGTSFRVVDIFGTQALARWPMLFSAIAGALPANQRVTAELIKLAQNPNQPLSLPPVDIVIFALAIIIIIVMLVWMVALMYQGYAVSCNLKGARAVISFILILLVAEVVSKLALWPLFKIALHKE